MVIRDEFREALAERLSGGQVDRIQASQRGAAIKCAGFIEQRVVEPQQRDPGKQCPGPADRRTPMATNRTDNLHASEGA